MWSPSSIVVVTRDLTLLGVGSFGILYQQLTGQIVLPLLILYTAMVGVPGAAGVMRLLARSVPIEPSSSAPQEPSRSSVHGS